MKKSISRDCPISDDRAREFVPALGPTYTVAQALPARVDQNTSDCRDFTMNRYNIDKIALSSMRG